jgi:hypothetical protein
MALCTAALFGVLVTWGNQAPGYYAGWGDHFVLSTEGIQWANSDAFAGDWFMATAPQPHWFFDIVTYLGALTGQISMAYALFWMAGLVAFGFATALLARKWAPRIPWIAALAVTVITTQTPWMLIGTGTLVIPQALPAVTGGDLIYLFVAVLILGRRRLAALIGTMVAIVHVQEGGVVAIILVVALVVDIFRTRKIGWPLVAGVVGSGFFLVFGMILRPVAANLSDFVRVCNEIIPYHCAAHTWGKTQIVSSLGIIALACLTFFFIKRTLRPMWLVSIGLVSFGLASGMVADYLQIPLLGEAAQAINVYRLGAVVLPFAVWGALYPIIKSAWNLRFGIVLTIWALSLFLFLYNPGWYLAGTRTPIFLSIVLVAVACAVLGNRFLRQRSARTVAAAAGASILALLFIFTAVVDNQLTVRGLNITFIQSDALRSWGAQVAKIVPVGQQIVTSPRDEYLKLITERGVIADCKDVPYGGIAWREWTERIDDLGGVAQCVAPGPLLYDDLSAKELVGVADKYKSDFIIVNTTQPPTIAALKKLGWNERFGASDGVALVLLERPS